MGVTFTYSRQRARGVPRRWETPKSVEGSGQWGLGPLSKMLTESARGKWRMSAPVDLCPFQLQPAPYAAPSRAKLT